MNRRVGLQRAWEPAITNLRTFIDVRAMPQTAFRDACAQQTAARKGAHAEPNRGFQDRRQTISPATTVATGPPRKLFPSKGEFLLFEFDRFTS